MRIALDAMGGDYAPQETVKGAIEAAKELEIGILLVGIEDILKNTRSQYEMSGLDIEIVHAPEIVAMGEHPAQAVRQKPDSSIVVATKLVASGKASAVVSAGNSGATMAAAFFHLGRIKGIERPAIATILPSLRERVLMIDAGANADCKPEYLVQFAEMGSIYMQRIFSVPSPKVGLLSIGEEETKGNQLVLETIPILKKSSLNFVGNVEGKDIAEGMVDVVVTDGFTGNVVLKVSEGVATLIFDVLKRELTRDVPRRLLSAMLRPAFREVKKSLDYSEYGGAPLLGVKGVSIIAHGRSNAKAIKNALRAAKTNVDNGLVQALTAS